MNEGLHAIDGLRSSPHGGLREDGLRDDKPVVAAFDFDGTLTRRETLLPFLLHVLGAAKIAWHGLVLSPTVAGYALGLVRNDVAKERVFVECLGGMRMDELQQEAGRFAEFVLPTLLRPAAMRRLAWHKRQGHRCVVVSASLELYVRPCALKAGFDDAAATRIEALPEGCTNGRIEGEHCYGAEKVRRLEAMAGARNGYILYAYGDSPGDRDLLSCADYPYYRCMPNPS